MKLKIYFTLCSISYKRIMHITLQILDFHHCCIFFFPFLYQEFFIRRQQRPSDLSQVSAVCSFTTLNKFILDVSYFSFRYFATFFSPFFFLFKWRRAFRVSINRSKKAYGASRDSETNRKRRETGSLILPTRWRHDRSRRLAIEYSWVSRRQAQATASCSRLLRQRS